MQDIGFIRQLPVYLAISRNIVPQLSALLSEVQVLVSTQGVVLGVYSDIAYTGGVVYPMMFQHLFKVLGFGWGVRISGAISAVCCAVATLTVTSLPSTQKTAPSVLNIKTFTDSQYILLAIGSSLVAFGVFSSFLLIPLSNLGDTTSLLYTTFLHRGLR